MHVLAHTVMALHGCVSPLHPHPPPLCAPPHLCAVHVHLPPPPLTPTALWTPGAIWIMVMDPPVPLTCPPLPPASPASSPPLPVDPRRHLDHGCAPACPHVGCGVQVHPAGQ